MKKLAAILAVLVKDVSLDGVRRPGRSDAGNRGETRQLHRSRTIWELAEVGYQEEKSCALLQDPLRVAGFEVESGVAGIPTAFVASWGTDKPVIGSASTTAAIAVKEWHGSSGTSGTIRLHRMISCAGKGSPIRATPWHPTGASFCCNLRRRAAMRPRTRFSSRRSGLVRRARGARSFSVKCGD